MSLTLRSTLIFLALSLSLISPGLVQSQSISNPPNSSEINDLAAELVRAASEEEQERLLAQKNKLMNSSLLAALTFATTGTPYIGATMCGEDDVFEGGTVLGVEAFIARRDVGASGIEQNFILHDDGTTEPITTTPMVWW